MAAISLTERDFETLAEAAMNAQDRGNMETALALDKIARKLNAALTQEKHRGLRMHTGSSKALTWRDVPSVIATVRR